MALLDVENLSVNFPVRSPLLRREVGRIRAVRSVSFSVNEGETLAVVGESGSGKTTMGRAVARLIRSTSTRMLFRGRDLAAARGAELLAARRDLQIVFQNPYSSLNRRHKIEEIISEPLRVHGVGDTRERRQRVRDLLQRVGLREDFADRYPAGLSGGQRQRVAIARALALNPKLIICDEPVSALDISVQAQILNLLLDLKRDLGISLLFITHDLGVVKRIADLVAVMHAGQIVEMAEPRALFAQPGHPYSRVLVSSVPRPDGEGLERIRLRGTLPSPLLEATGCLFAGRCYKAQEICKRVIPPVISNRPGNWALCHFPENIAATRVEEALL